MIISHTDLSSSSFFFVHRKNTCLAGTFLFYFIVYFFCSFFPLFSFDSLLFLLCKAKQSIHFKLIIIKFKKKSTFYIGFDHINSIQLLLNSKGKPTLYLLIEVHHKGWIYKKKKLCDLNMVYECIDPG